MGQRLTSSIYLNDEEIAKVYYHWSAYYISSLEEAMKFIDLFENPAANYLPSYDYKLRCIRIVEKIGGGIDQTKHEPKAIQMQYPNKKFKKSNISRNEGLIAITPQGMYELDRWSEGQIDIDFDERVVHNCLPSVFNDKEEMEDFVNSNDIKIDEIVELDFDPCEIPFDRLDDAIEVSKGHENKIFVFEGTYFYL